MQSEGLCEKAATVASHVAEQVKLYERHSDEQGRKVELFRAQASHLVQRYEDQCSLLRSERDAKQLENDGVKHRCSLLEQYSDKALQEKTHTLNKMVTPEGTIVRQTQTIRELNEQAVALAAETAAAKAEAMRSECKLAPGAMEWTQERRELITRLDVLESRRTSMAAMLDQAAARSKEQQAELEAAKVNATAQAD